MKMKEIIIIQDGTQLLSKPLYTRFDRDMFEIQEFSLRHRLRNTLVIQQYKRQIIDFFCSLTGIRSSSADGFLLVLTRA